MVKANQNKNEIVERYLSHNRKETNTYNKFVEARQSEQKEANDLKNRKANHKIHKLQSKIKVKKAILQEILPKFFLAKIQEKKDIDVLTGKSQDQSDPKFENKELDSATNKIVPMNKEQPPKGILDNSPQTTKAKTGFGSILSGAGFSGAVFKKQAITMGAGVCLELKDRNPKGTKPIICAREGFCMVLCKHHFTNQPKEIFVLGGIGSDIIPTLDHLNLSCNLFLPS